MVLLRMYVLEPSVSFQNLIGINKQKVGDTQKAITTKLTQKQTTPQVNWLRVASFKRTVP